MYKNPCQDDFFNPPPIFLDIITSTLPAPQLSPRRRRPAARGAMAPPIRRRLLLVLLLPVLAVAALPAAAAAASCRAWLVQSIPTDMPHLRRVPGVLSTADVLQWLSGNATKNLDILAQYWQLIAQPKNPKSGDYGFSESDMARFGADQGLRVYKALENAADRKVKIRIVQHSGFAPEFDQESADLAAGRPNVQNATLLFEDWWGSGVLHAKVWISDKKDLYIGSANNDWKSLTQPKIEETASGSHARAAPGRSHLQPKKPPDRAFLAVAAAGAGDRGGALAGEDGEGWAALSWLLLFAREAEQGESAGVGARAGVGAVCSDGGAILGGGARRRERRMEEV
nr:uncharacterized protein LOC127317588 isoform X2 [Lolium perenne]